MVEQLKKDMHNKLTECLDKMTAVDTYDERYKILDAFTLQAYRAGADMALEQLSIEMKKRTG